MAMECSAVEGGKELRLSLVHGGPVAGSSGLQDEQSCGRVSSERFVGVAV